jgi:hypothetical protein
VTKASAVDSIDIGDFTVFVRLVIRSSVFMSSLGLEALQAVGALLRQ